MRGGAELFIVNAHLVMRDFITPLQTMAVEKGRISSLQWEGELPAKTNVIDAKGGYILPGFIDLHVHGGGGADFMDGTAAAFRTAARAHLEHGTTTLLATSLSADCEALRHFIDAYKAVKERGNAGNIAGLHLEGPYLSGNSGQSKGAQPSSVLRPPDREEIRFLLEYADGAIRRWDAAPELEGSTLFAEEMRSHGVLCSIAHSEATAEQAREAFDEGFSHVTHFYNALSRLQKRGQRVCAGVTEAALLCEEVSIEMIGDGRHVPREAFRLAVRQKGVGRVSVITDANRLAASDLQEGRLGHWKNGVSVIREDGVAKLPDRSSYAGSVCTMDQALKNLYFSFGLSLPDITVMMSGTPARLLGISDKTGSLQVGKDADLVLTDTQMEVEKVLLKGKVVEKNNQ